MATTAAGPHGPDNRHVLGRGPLDLGRVGIEPHRRFLSTAAAKDEVFRCWGRACGPRI